MCGNYQLFGTLPAAFSSQNPIRFQLVSHKVLRLAVPWALLGILALSMFGFEYPIARLLLISQLVFYGTVGVSIWRGASRPRLVCAATAFVMMNAAAWVAFWVWAFGRADRVWVPTPYEWREPAARVEPMQ